MARKQKGQSSGISEKKMGRPSVFSDRLVERLLEMATKGATDAQLAKAAGVSITTLKNWKAAHPDFLAALKEAKNLADDLVEASLYMRATGYSHPAIKIFCSQGAVITEKYIERYPPDVTACIFWLKNRQPERWREKQLGKNEGQEEKSPQMLLLEAMEKMNAGKQPIS